MTNAAQFIPGRMVTPVTGNPLGGTMMVVADIERGPVRVALEVRGLVGLMAATGVASRPSRLSQLSSILLEVAAAVGTVSSVLAAVALSAVGEVLLASVAALGVTGRVVASTRGEGVDEGAGHSSLCASSEPSISTFAVEVGVEAISGVAPGVGVEAISGVASDVSEEVISEVA